MRFKLLLIPAFFSACLFAHAASIIGSTVDVKYEFPSTGVVLTDSGPLVVTSGLTIVSPSNANLTFTSASQITITNPGLGPFTTSSFNGFEVDVLSGFTLTSAVIDASSNPALLGAIVTITGNDLFVNFSGTCATCGGGDQNLILDINGSSTAVTPEPSSFALLGTGILAVAGAVRRRLT